jgi:hypothetical protein
MKTYFVSYLGPARVHGGDADVVGGRGRALINDTRLEFQI